jgi:hypothetical protein
MKTTLLTIIQLSFLSQVCFAQDVITYRNGTEAKVKVTEITSTDVKFKKEDNLDGPFYTASKSEIFMIRYENGVKDVFENNEKQVTTNKHSNSELPGNDQRIKYSGPRFGFTVIGNGTARDYIVNDLGKKPFVTQFGWQLETRVFTLDNGMTGLFEWVGLVGGVEQGMFLPSLTSLFGIRGKNGWEFGVGPNLSVTGFAMAFAAGTSFRSGNVYFPVNLAVVTSVPRKGYVYNPDTGEYDYVTEHTGLRVGLTIGFNTRKS